jgi:GDPmannose 4,6-dehydratase
MWLMLQQPTNTIQDGVIATGESHTIREFVEAAFSKIGKQIMWRGTGLDEKGYDANDPTRVLVQVDAKYFRPFEVENLRGDASKMQKILNWKPQVTFDQLVDIMVTHDLHHHHQSQAR